MSKRQWKRSENGPPPNRLTGGPDKVPNSKIYLSSKKWKKMDSEQEETRGPQNDLLIDPNPLGICPYVHTDDFQNAVNGSSSSIIDLIHKDKNETHSEWTRTSCKSIVRVQHGGPDDSSKNIVDKKNDDTQVSTQNLFNRSSSWSINNTSGNRKWTRADNNNDMDSSAQTQPQLSHPPTTTINNKSPRHHVNSIESASSRMWLRRSDHDTRETTKSNITRPLTKESTSYHRPTVKRIRFMDMDKSKSETSSGLTDFAYRETRHSKRSHRNMGLIRVKPVLDQTPICPSLLQGKHCDNEHCTFRHDLSSEAVMPLCSFFQRNGQCFKIDSCPFRHVKVSDSAPICTNFQRLGFCQNPKCSMKHIRSKRYTS